MTSSRDDSTLDIVIACMLGAVTVGVLGFIGYVLARDAGQFAHDMVLSTAVAAGIAAAAAYLVRRGHTGSIGHRAASGDRVRRTP